MSEGVYVGDAAVDAPGDRGWLLGHFKPAGDLRHSDEVEIKWGMHPPGDRRAAWVRGEARRALLILVSGRFRMEFPGRQVVLSKPGQYVVWGRGVDHSWYAEQESVVLTVRWPSVPGYAVPDATAAGTAADPAVAAGRAGADPAAAAGTGADPAGPAQAH
ncbi:signal peptidase I [Plantactinospora sp. KBS50]|uniref:signal peptidase I n=1 Tax=Plantactinospora sp. KBS50 TaxID=2024580 RepID=UPI001E30CF96|nr:signal peptidase I [Plantactinospora sp. KBS50]